MKRPTRYERVLSSVKDSIRIGITFKHPASKFTARYIEIMNSADALKLTRYKRGFIRGWYECELNHIWQLVEFCYWIDGVQHSTSKDSIFPRVPAESMRGNVCAHYWKGTDKPYTEEREID